MKRHLFSIILCALALVSGSVNAAKNASADWYLYVYSDTLSLDQNIGQFQTTDEANIFVIASCDVTAQGVNFCVHNNSWSSTYGWKSEGVTTTGVEVELATAKQANGWLDLPAGTYKVTFNSSALTIRFDEPDPEPDPTFLRGGDLSMATYLEDWGIVYKDSTGVAGDVFDILAEYGINLARLRLYHTPGTAVTKSDGTYRTPVKTRYNNWAGRENYYAGLTDVLNLATRAKNHNMKICLSIYLSDFWSGADQQFIPAAWASVSDRATLGDSVYNYVLRVMNAMKEQGTTPEYVSIGNESNYGILYHDLYNNEVSFGGKVSGGYSNYIYLHNRAAAAIREVAPDAQIIVHHSYGDSGKIGICRNFFLALNNGDCDYDIVGGSYYPHWATDHNASDCTPTGMLTWAQDMENKIGKQVMLMEVGYSWHPYKCPGRNGGEWAGQLGTNGCYAEATETGQESFIRELHTALRTDENILGYMYWDPIFVDQQVGGYWAETCWAEKYSGSGTTWWNDGNVISNTTLFDFEGNPLKALYREIASYAPAKPDTPTSVENVQGDNVQCTKVLKEGQLYLMYKGTMYDVQGRRIR